MGVQLGSVEPVGEVTLAFAGCAEKGYQIYDVHLSGGTSGSYHGDIPFFCLMFATSFRSIESVFSYFFFSFWLYQRNKVNMCLIFNRLPNQGP